MTPEAAGRLVASGHTVIIETQAGSAAGYADHSYSEVGATPTDRAASLATDLVVAIHPPDPTELDCGGLLGLLRPFDDLAAIQTLAGTGIDLFAFEAVPRSTRAQSMDVLSSQATASGYQAVLLAATLSGRFFPMLTTAAGTIRPSSVLILGAGVAGLQAIATARRLGAAVSAFDVRAAAGEQVQSLGARFIELDVPAQDERAAGGYARELADDQQAKVVAALAEHVAAADVVISTAAIPGRTAPLLISASAVEEMKPGSVIVDLAASTGGNCELTVADRTIDHSGVTIVGDTHLVSGVATHASQMYARNASAFLALLTGEDACYAPDWEDEIVVESCVARGGQLVHPRLIAEPSAAQSKEGARE